VPTQIPIRYREVPTAPAQRRASRPVHRSDKYRHQVLAAFILVFAIVGAAGAGLSWLVNR